MAPTRPFGVPQVVSLAFWGGVWGFVFSWVEPKFPRGAGYWIAALLFGAIFPTLVAWFVVAPIKGQPVADGRSEEHTSELQSLMRISYAVFCLKKKTHNKKLSAQHINTRR